MKASDMKTCLRAQRTLLFVILISTAVSACRSDGANRTGTAAKGEALYRENCAACHGRRGEGDGAAAIAVLVAPRDFRREPFRYVSALNGVATRDDVVQTIRNGRRFGEMPAHPYLTDREVDLLAEYVVDLHRRGWIEKLSKDEDLEPDEVQEIAREKITAENTIEVPAPPAGFRPNTALGARLYAKQCASCHGPTGKGDGLDRPKDSRGRPIAVRDLTIGEFRGGNDPVEVFKRMRCGIPGTPMPAQAQLSDEQIWQLTYYSLYLAGEYRFPRVRPSSGKGER